MSYRSAVVAARAIESCRRNAAAASLTFEAIVVVNSGDAEEARALENTADRVLVPARDLGFAGGLNAGLEVARGECAVLSNPDVIVRPGALRALCAASRSELVAAGPEFFLDEGETIHVPPARSPPSPLSRGGGSPPPVRHASSGARSGAG